MTNGDYFRGCDDHELAELLTTLIVGVVQQGGGIVTQTMIDKEINHMYAYLQEEVVKGEYPN